MIIISNTLDFELYKQIIDSLCEFPDPIRVIRLYKEGEPLVNPRFADMVRYAKESPYVQRVDTTTNGSLLTPERSLAIIDAGLDRINISVEGINEAQYLDFSGYSDMAIGLARMFGFKFDKNFICL